MQQPPYGQGRPGYQGFPQQPGYPPGYPQQGYPPPGYGVPVPPPKKKRTGLIVGILVAVLLLGAAIPFGIFAKDYFASTGAAPVSSPVPPECQVSPQTLEKAGFPSFAGTGRGSASSDVPGLKQIGCGFKPGPDENVRDATLNIRIVEYSGEDALQEAKRNLLPTKPEVPPTDVPGIGDKAALVHLVTQSAFSGAELHILTGTNVVTVEISGWDKGFFSNSPMPQREVDDAVKAVGGELVKKLPR